MSQRAPKINSVFFPYEEKKERKLLPAGGPPSYHSKVLMHDWQFRLPDAECGCHGKFRRSNESTFKRLGPDDEPIGISTTQAAWHEALKKKDPDEYSRYRSLLNLLSFPLTETEECKRALRLADFDLPKPSEPTDYRTTLRDDYPWHFPEKRKDPILHDIPDPPWYLYRRIFGYSSDDLLRRPGITKFLDDNFDIQNRAAALKMPRFVSFNPMIGEYTDTKRHSEALLKNSSIDCSR